MSSLTVILCLAAGLSEAPWQTEADHQPSRDNGRLKSPASVSQRHAIAAGAKVSAAAIRTGGRSVQAAGRDSHENSGPTTSA